MTRVWQYGVQRHWDVPAPVLEQIRLGHQLRNELVAIDRHHDERMTALTASDELVSSIDQRMAPLVDKLDALRGAVSASRSAGRSKTSDPALRAEERALAAEIKALRAERKAAASAARQNAKPALEALRADRKAAVKATYATYVQRDGLHWATWNEVTAHHETSRQRVIALRRQGRPADSRFARWAGEGTIAAQLQRGADQQRPRSAATLAAPDSPWRNVVAFDRHIDETAWSAMTRAEQRRYGRVTVRISYGHGRGVEVPIIMHRPLPPDVEVVSVTLTRRMLAGHPVVTVQFVCRTPDPHPRAAGPLVAVHGGWRTLSDGMRVAVLRSTTPIVPPVTVADVVRPVDGGWQVVLPAPWRDVRDRLDGVAARRSVSLDEIRAEVVAWMRTTAETVETLELRSHPSTWRSPGRFAWLARHLAGVRPEAPITARLEAWRRQDRHLWEWHAHELDQVTGRRRDAYRRVAAWIASTAGAVLLDDWSVREVRARPVGDDDTYAEEQSRRNGQWAATAELMDAVRQAAERDGVTVEKAAAVSGIHARCGGVLPAAVRQRGIMVVCERCGVAVDQDVNVTVGMLDERSGGGADAGDRSNPSVGAG